MSEYDLAKAQPAVTTQTVCLSQLGDTEDEFIDAAGNWVGRRQLVAAGTPVLVTHLSSTGSSAWIVLQSDSTFRGIIRRDKIALEEGEH
jgi:hypothetical protein